jgi:hypothetical protein
MADHDDTRTAEAIDTGEPISVLRDLEEPVSDTFMGALNRRIQRRLLAADVSRLTWSGPIRVVLEILSLIFSIGAHDPEERKE